MNTDSAGVMPFNPSFQYVVSIWRIHLAQHGKAMLEGGAND